jgi:hypothetical protein
MEQKNKKFGALPNVILNTDHFTGQYVATGGNYYQHTTHLHLIKVCERKTQTKNKPPLYVVSRSIDGQFPFLSSLYPQPKKDTFIAEINRIYFYVTISENTINVTKK